MSFALNQLWTLLGRSQGLYVVQLWLVSKESAYILTWI